eukprot:TRINITY_DN31283_c0_g1_i1.p1 TRINITY_DN31283_c0_g1~~TRINITY_DN31283_c0_g1_i1.p1  ORF type:complete len:339 (-),score=41.30 TRINITY_DN31283_c0_g1_i1:58-1074(-)
MTDAVESSDGLDDLFAKITKQFEREKNSLEHREVELKTAQEILIAEKAAMNALGVRVTHDEILNINVGGKLFATQRSTLLTAPEGSMLHSMFSGRWEQCLQHDAQGNIFLDMSPSIFGKILAYLRTLRLAPPEMKLAPPTPDPGDEQEFTVAIGFLGLEDFFFGLLTDPSARLRLRACKASDCLLISSCGRHATRLAGSGRMFAVGERHFIEDAVHWKVKLTCISHWVFFGVCTNDEPQGTAFLDQSAFGWSSRGQVYAAGAAADQIGLPGWQTGDVAILRWERDHRALTVLQTSTGERSQLTLPDGDHPWRIMVSLHDAGDSIELLSASAADCELFQ